MTALLNAIETIVGPKGLLTGDAVAERATSYWDAMPTTAQAIVRPGTSEELAAILALCHERGQPVATQPVRPPCVTTGCPRS